MRPDSRPDGSVKNQTPSGRGTWQRFGDPGSAPRQSVEQLRRQNLQENRMNDSPRFSQPPRGEPQSIRTAPPVVRERPGASDAAPRSYSAPGYGGPRQSGGSERRQFGPGGEMGSPRQSGGGMIAPPRQYSQPGSSQPSYSQPRQSGGSGGGGSRQLGGGGMSPRQSGGGGGGMSSPRQSGGGNMSSPRQSGGGGGSRNSGNGGGQGGGGGHGRR